MSSLCAKLLGKQGEKPHCFLTIKTVPQGPDLTGQSYWGRPHILSSYSGEEGTV